MSLATTKNVPRFTPEQYLALERRAEFRSEFDNGIIEAMSGASRWNSLITGNVLCKIGDVLRNRPSEVYAVNMRVWIGPARQLKEIYAKVQFPEPVEDDD